MMKNNRKIFKLLNEYNNDNLSDLKKVDLRHVLYYLNKYNLEYRKLLNIDKDITFGIEMEFEYFNGSVIDFWPFECEINNILGDNDWVVKNDITLVFGRELATEVYTDREKTWSDILSVCDYTANYLSVGQRSAGHINIGSHVLGNDTIYWYRFLKLWTAYENVIYRFGYGEYLSYFPFIKLGSKPVASILVDRLDCIRSFVNGDINEFICNIFPKDIKPAFLKKNGISFYKMLDKFDYSRFEYDNVLEIRNPLSTLDVVIWQNYVNFFVHLLLYCKSDRFNEDIIDKRINVIRDVIVDIDNYDNIYLDEALELSDMIFDNNLDKIYFLRQYLKNFDVSNERFKKAKKYTISNSLKKY